MRRAGLRAGAEAVAASLGPSPPDEQGLVEVGSEDCRLLPVLVPKYATGFAAQCGL